MPFYVRDLIVLRFWYPWGSWGQSPEHTEGICTCLYICDSVGSVFDMSLEWDLQKLVEGPGASHVLVQPLRLVDAKEPGAQSPLLQSGDSHHAESRGSS
jgi:hypothetical protein